MREIRGLNEALQRIRGELISNLSKLTELDKRIAREKQKLSHDGLEEVSDDVKQEIQQRLNKLQEERAVRLEAASATREEF